MAAAQEITTLWRDHDQIAGQKSWSPSEFSHFKKHAFKEKDPYSGAALSGQGILLSDLVDRSLEAFTPEQRAAVDLLVLKSRDGKQAFMPRYFAAKYPVIVYESGAKETLIPVTNAHGVRSERLPVENFFIQDLAGIELTTYQSAFASFYLKKRSDPKSIRGERIVVQNCMSCHGGTSLKVQPAAASVTLAPPARFLAEAAEQVGAKTHPRVPGYLDLADDERKALSCYLNARKLETPN